MKNKNTLLWLVAAFFALLTTAFAQTKDFSAVDVTSPTSIVQWLTPLLVPLIITYVRKWQPQIPSWVWPTLAPVLGAVATLIESAITKGDHSVLVGALLGLAGVGVREIKTNLIPPKEPVIAPGSEIMPPPSNSQP